VIDQSIIVAGGTGLTMWFADKVFGKALEPLGVNLSAFLADRWRSIASRAGETSAERQIEPQAISPGLLARMVMDASFSADDPEITDWWANLFVDASLMGSNRHAVFSDMMALLGPEEARCLDDFIRDKCSPDFGKDALQHDYLDGQFQGDVRPLVWSEDGGVRPYDEILSDLSSMPTVWPVRCIEWCLPVAGSEEINGFGSDPWYDQNLMTLGTLQRAGIMRPVSASFSVWGGNVWVKGIALTALGYEFYRTCRGCIVKSD